MNYLQYVVAAYAVFGIVMLWEYIVPRIAIRQQLRAARLREARVQNQRMQNQHKDTGFPLSRD